MNMRMRNEPLFAMCRSEADCGVNSASDLAPVVQKLDNAIHRINHYPLDITIGFAITYPVDSDLSGG